jgi:hypothetical protein
MKDPPLDWGRLLGDWSAELGVDWERCRAIEVARHVPRLTDAFVRWKAKEFLTLALDENAADSSQLIRWAARYPQARFFVGPLSTFAQLTAGRFDWASQIDTFTASAAGRSMDPIAARDSISSNLPDLSRLLRRRGCLFLRSPELSSGSWSQAAADHERSQLRVVGTRLLGDGTQLIVSRRK